MPLLLPLLLVLLVTAGGGSAAGPKLGCRDQNGAAVDWYVLYKLPIMPKSEIQFVRDGVGFLHFSSASDGERWAFSSVSIMDSLSAPGQTLTPVYDDPKRDSLIYVFYNDGNPNGTTNSVKGHTKGAVAFDGDSGFWLVHSVPKFPPAPADEQYSYAINGKKNGQSFLCLSLSSKQLETVAKQLLFNEPYLYAKQMSPALKTQYPTMARVIAGERRSESPWSGIEKLTTSGGAAFTSYAKARNFADDLYSALVAPNLFTGLFTQTWQYGPTVTRLPSNCLGTYPVYNVKSIMVTATLPTSREVTFDFSTTKDHSKWAVSEDEAHPWVCVGDINRVSAQAKRGGGTVCHSSPVLWRLYSQLVAQSEPCLDILPAWVYRSPTGW